MTIATAVVAPEYNSFYVAGVEDVDIPLDHDRQGIVGTAECINIGCLYWNDGDTTITLGLYNELPVRSNKPRFDGMLKTPERRVLVFDVHMPEILSMDVTETVTRVRVWANHPSEPDEVIIALG